MTDKEYLERPLLPGLEYEISSRRVRIVSDNTIFVSVQSIEKLVQEDILVKYKELLALCKQYSIKIVYKNSLKKSLLALWGDYTREVDEYTTLYEELRKKAEKVQRRGIHYGCSDDAVLKELSDWANSMNPYMYRSSAISQVNEIFREIMRLKMHIRSVYENERESGYTSERISKIYL